MLSLLILTGEREDMSRHKRSSILVLEKMDVLAYRKKKQNYIMWGAKNPRSRGSTGSRHVTTVYITLTSNTVSLNDGNCRRDMEGRGGGKKQTQCKFISSKDWGPNKYKKKDKQQQGFACGHLPYY